MRRTTPIALTLLAALAQGCTSCDNVPDSAVTECQQSVVIPGVVRTDILFVIDDSGSMNDEQDALRDGLWSFINTLESAPIEDQFQIGVTTTSVIDYNGGAVYGATRPGNSAPTPYPQGIVVATDPLTTDTDPLHDPTDPLVYGTWGDFLWTDVPGAPDPGFYGTRIMRWDSPTLLADFQRNVLVGVKGAGREMPFEAAMRALTDQVTGENSEFRRAGARLAVIFLSDEDDCSGPEDANITTNAECRSARTDPASTLRTIPDVASFFAARGAIVASIVGVTCTAGDCTSDTTICSGATTYPDRFIALRNALGPARTRLASICDASFDATLADIATAIVSRSVPLEGEPADWRMLVVGLSKASGARVSCTVAELGTPDAATADAVYSPPAGGEPASLTFQDAGACMLERGDKIEIDLICAG